MRQFCRPQVGGRMCVNSIEHHRSLAITVLIRPCSAMRELLMARHWGTITGKAAERNPGQAEQGAGCVNGVTNVVTNGWERATAGNELIKPT